jgi:hypothetical protein
MSSIGSSPRQIPVGLSAYPQYQSEAVAIAKAAYVFIPDSGNYVGNYPPGHMLPLGSPSIPSETDSIVLLNDVAQGLPYNLVNILNGDKGTFILRDTGKTLFAELYKDFSTPTGKKGYFREVQVLLPQPIVSTQGFLGGVNGNVFGVYGSVPQYAPYATIYLPTNVDGVFNKEGTGNPLKDPTPQGQM